MHATWTVAAADLDDPVVTGLVREYLADIAGRYYGRPATTAEIDLALAEDPDDGLRPPDGVFLLARNETDIAGCAGIRRMRPGIAELKRMYVRPAARGQGVAGRLIAAAEQHARDLGCRAIRLDTRDDLVEARNLYAKHGFREIPAYNDARYAEHWFEKKLP